MPRRSDDNWSQWRWSEREGCYESHRRLSDGTYEYKYESASTEARDATPRSNPLVTMYTSSSEATSSYDQGPDQFSPHASHQYHAQTTGEQGLYADQALGGVLGQFGHMNLNQNYTPHQPQYPSMAIPSSSSLSTTNFIRPSNVKSSKGKGKDGFGVHYSSEFVFGRILLIHWSEPRGTNNTIITKMSTGKHHSHDKLRRFLIVRTTSGHSVCLAIQTYNNRGTNKPGCHPEDHAVIYSTEKAVYLSGEHKSRMKPSIFCKMDKQHKLDAASRINYAKLYTIEHNCEVNFIGKIGSSYNHKVGAAYNSVHPALSEEAVVDYTNTEHAPTGYHAMNTVVTGTYGVPSMDIGESSYHGQYENQSYSEY